MPLITRADLARVAPHGAANIVGPIVDHADDVLVRYGLATTARLPDFMAHVLVESAYLTTCAENLNYSAERLHAVWPSRFPTVASAESYAHNPEALANKVYGGRMGNTGPNDGWLNRGQGLLETTGHDNIAALAKHMGLTFEAARIALTSPEMMLECAAANYVMLGAAAYADKGDIVGSTRRVNGGLNGLADRRTMLALCRKVWPRAVAPAPVKIAVASAAPAPKTPLPKKPIPPVLPTPPKDPAPVKVTLPIFAVLAGLFGFAGAAHAGDTGNLAPYAVIGVQDIVVPGLLALLSGGGIGALVVLPLKRFMDAKTSKELADNVDQVLSRAIAYAAKQAEAYLGRQDFHLNVDGWVQELAVKYAMDHAPKLMKKAGASLAKSVQEQIGEKIQARIGSHEDVLALKSASVNAGQPLDIAPALHAAA